MSETGAAGAGGAHGRGGLGGELRGERERGKNDGKVAEDFHTGGAAKDYALRPYCPTRRRGKAIFRGGGPAATRIFPSPICRFPLTPKTHHPEMPASRKKKRSAAPLKLAVIQMRCVASPAANQKNAERKIRAAAKMGAGLVCLPELFRSLYFCQEEDHANFELAETIPGPTTEALGALAARTRRRDRRVALRAARGRALPQHRRDHRRGRHAAREVPQDAHPGRSALLREVLFHARRPRLSQPGTRRSARSASASAGTNGIPRPPG